MKAIRRSVARNYSVLLFSSLILYIAVASLAAFGFNYKLNLGSIAYFLLTYMALKHLSDLKPVGIFSLIILPIIIAIIYFNIFYYKTASISAPSNIFLLVSAFTGLLFHKSKNWLYPVLLITLLSAWQFKGNSMFMNYITYGPFGGQVNERIPLTKFYNDEGAIVYPKISKTVILDFWNSKCGVCYQLFPYVESIHKKIDTSKFELRVVNIPILNEKKEDNYNLLKRFPYSFKQLFTDHANSLDSFKITGFPTTIVLRENKIIYRGDFKYALKLLDIL